MNWESFFSHPLVILIADFVLSLIATFVLFRFLKSSATIIKAEWRAGGAIAGFILIFSMAFYFSDSWLEKYIYTTKRFNISGTVLLDSCFYHDGTYIEELPPVSHILSEKDGGYTLMGVGFKSKKIKEVTISFQHENFIPIKHTFKENGFTIDYDKLQINLNDTIRLKKIPMEILRQTGN
ncbi:MAG: hypothetical protein NT004_00995 [Bacteroidetes bacterium]|nr:hypothetical protein [Bacteroidota bacterium]